MIQFDHEKFDVYKVSLDFLTLSEEIISQLIKHKGNISDQLHRAATSIILNIAEGAGEFAKVEKKRFYRMAKRSACECAAIMDICKNLDSISEENYQESKELLFRITSMLVKMAK